MLENSTVTSKYFTGLLTQFNRSLRNLETLQEFEGKLEFDWWKEAAEAIYYLKSEQHKVSLFINSKQK